jgi:hypothetical protein
MQNRYFLKSDQADCVRFDAMAYQGGRDAGGSLSVQDARNALQDKASLDQAADVAFEQGEFHADSLEEEYPGIYVEDLEEARARFVSEWVRGFVDGCENTLSGAVACFYYGKPAYVNEVGDVPILTVWPSDLGVPNRPATPGDAKWAPKGESDPNFEARIK